MSREWKGLPQPELFDIIPSMENTTPTTKPRKTIPRLGTEDLESLKTELSEMRRVKAWLEKRLGTECCADAKQTLKSALDYVANSIQCFEHDFEFMSKSEPA